MLFQLYVDHDSRKIQDYSTKKVRKYGLWNILSLNMGKDRYNDMVAYAVEKIKLRNEIYKDIDIEKEANQCRLNKIFWESEKDNGPNKKTRRPKSTIFTKKF